LSFALRERVCGGWTNQAIEITACCHISRAHHLAASAGTFSKLYRKRRPRTIPSSWGGAIRVEYFGAPSVEASMRTIVLVLLAPAVISLTSTDADAGSWCASYRRGVSNCSYSSFEQCRATVLGLGGFCRPNPFPGTAYGTGAGSWNTPGSPRRYRRGY
jgi:hypothetical protein